MDVLPDEQSANKGSSDHAETHLHHDLESVEASGLRDLYFGVKLDRQVLANDPIRAREKGKDGREQGTLSVGKGLDPIGSVARQVDLVCSPKRLRRTFVPLPKLVKRCSIIGMRTQRNHVP